MPSGNIYGNTSNSYIQSCIEWSYWQSTEDNKSYVTASLWYRRTNSYSGTATHGSWSGSITINGSTTSGSYSGTFTVPNNNSWVKAMEVSGVGVPHNSDGSKDVYIEGSGGLSGSTSLSWTSVGQTISLNTIPRASELVLPENIWLGKQCTLKVDRKSTDFKHTIDFRFECTSYETDYSGYIVQDSASTTVYWTPNAAKLGKKIPNSRGGRGTFVITTYNSSGASIGSKSYSFYATIQEDEDTKPSLSASFSVSDGNTSLTGVEKLIAEWTSVTATIDSCAAKYGASIDEASKKITYGNQSVSGNTATFLAVANTAKVSVTVKDTRGFSQTVEKTYPIVNWIEPTAIVESANITAAGNLTATVVGNVYNGSFGSTDNAVSLKLRCANNGETTWTVLSGPSSIEYSGNTYRATYTSDNFDYQKTYQLKASAWDKLLENEINARNLNMGISEVVTVRSKPVFDWSKNDFAFHVPVSVDGALTTTGEVVSGANITAHGNVTVDGTSTFQGHLHANSGIEMAGMLSSPSGYGNFIFFDNRSYSDFGLSAGYGDDFLKTWIKWLCQTYPDVSRATFIGQFIPASQWTVIGCVYNTSDLNSEGLPRYCGFLAACSADNDTRRFSTYNFALSTRTL